MTNTILEKIPIAANNTQTPNALLALTTKVRTCGKKNLVAQWLKAEKSQLYCQWVLED